MVPSIRGERIALRPADMCEASALWKLVKTPPAIAGFPEPASGPESVARWMADTAAAGVLVWTIRHDGQIVGLVTAEMRSGAIATVGYTVEEAWSGRSVATEALQAVTDWLFTERLAHRVEVCVATGSFALWRVAQQAGFVLEGVARESWSWGGVWHDARNYALLRRDWMAARRSSEAPQWVANGS